MRKLIRTFARTCLVLVTGAASASLLFGCQVVDDPTEHAFPITFKNDTNWRLLLKLCSDDDCDHFDYSHKWNEGESHRENATDDGVLTRWLVEEAGSGRTLGCLPLKFHQKHHDVVVRISQLVSCPGKRPLQVKIGSA